MDDLDRPHVPVFGYSWVPGRRFAYLAEQRLIAVLMVDGINLGWMTTNQISRWMPNEASNAKATPPRPTAGAPS